MFVYENSKMSEYELDIFYFYLLLYLKNKINVPAKDSIKTD